MTQKRDVVCTSQYWGLRERIHENGLVLVLLLPPMWEPGGLDSVLLVGKVQWGKKWKAWAAKGRGGGNCRASSRSRFLARVLKQERD